MSTSLPFRVVCVDDAKGCRDYYEASLLAKGNIYNVISVHTFDNTSREKVAGVDIEEVSGNYYVLAECNPDNAYHESLFQIINENQKDELELVEQRKQEVEILK